MVNAEVPVFDIETRYQIQPWHEKFKRRIKYQWNLPWQAYSLWRQEVVNKLMNKNYERLKWRACWKVACGRSHGKMEIWSRWGNEEGEW